jgi:fibro-slime domain-containing protein
MNSKTFSALTLMLGFTFGLFELSFGQGGPYPPITFKGKLRDFREIPDDDKRAGNEHPDFNNDAFVSGCAGTGFVSEKIQVGPVPIDTTFKNDNRNPRLVNSKLGSKQCFTDIVPPGPTTRFDQWFTDSPDREINRPFLTDLVFTTTDGVNYNFADPVYFPLDNTPGSFGRTLPVGGANSNHNFGFTLEFHQPFTYLKGKGQQFNFRGDDDVWVYIDDSLAIDLGGVHGPSSKSIDLDVYAAKKGMKDGQSYMMDFFFAERHTTQSNLQITTSLVLGMKQVQPVIPTERSISFISQITIGLSTLTEGAEIRYTLDGSIPTETTGIIYNPAVQIPIIQTTTINAIAFKPGFTKSELMTEVYTKSPSKSILDILDQNGNPLTNNYLTEKNSGFTVKITTTQAGLPTITDTASTSIGKDLEILTQGPAVEQGGKLVYTGLAPLIITPLASNTILKDGKANAVTYDSLTVKWVNPKDPTDIAISKVQIRPAPVQATAYFSKTADGSQVDDTFAGTETTVYIFVTDQVLPPGMTPKITLETTPKLVSGRISDKLILDLVAVSPGKYRAIIPVDINPSAIPTDLKLQLAVEDQIKATYVDPLDGANTVIIEQPAVATAGYGIAPEIEGNLQFTDKNFNVLPGGVYYNPAELKLYLTYSDDYAAGLIPTKSVSITVVNTNGNSTGTPDAETFNINLNLAKKVGNTGIWEGSIDLADGPSINPNNNKVETYVLGKVTGVVIPHNKNGTQIPSSPVKDDLLVAYPDKVASPQIEGPNGPGVVIKRVDDSIKVIIKEQSISSALDTLYTSLSCTKSGDKVVNIMLIETAPSSGEYVSKFISKSEGALIVDGILQCSSTDNIKLDYRDPAYGIETNILVPIDEPVTTKLYYVKSLTDTTVIGSVNENNDLSFTVIVEAFDPNVNTKDQVEVTITTPQGELEKFMAMETGKATGKFTVQIPYGFVITKPTVMDNKLQGQITPQILDNRVNATGSVTINGSTRTAQIILIAAFNPVKKAYIKDVTGVKGIPDGQADQVYIVFEKPLPKLPNSFDAQWNSTGSPTRTASIGNLSFVPGTDSSVVVADFSNPPFALNLTAPASGQVPKAILPSNDALFSGQSPALEDSLGPTIVKAEKLRTAVNALIPNDPSFYHDTLLITVSEALKSTTDFKEMLKFAISCDDYVNARPIIAYREPTKVDDTLYTVIVDKSAGPAPVVGNCIFLNSDLGRYTDIHFNLPPKVGVELKGKEPPPAIELFRGYPPVAGLDANSTTFQVAVQDSRNPSKEGYATPVGTEWQVLWIPPWNYTNEGAPLKPNNITNLRDLERALATTTPEGATPVVLPGTVSTVQVISSAPYIAHVSIFDIYGNFVNSSIQVFGAHGELKNIARVVNKGLQSYLYWDMRDKKGQLAGQGVYVWKVRFEFLGGKQEIQYTKTGIMRK